MKRVRHKLLLVMKRFLIDLGKYFSKSFIFYKTNGIKVLNYLLINRRKTYVDQSVRIFDMSPALIQVLNYLLTSDPFPQQ